MLPSMKRVSVFLLWCFWSVALLRAQTDEPVTVVTNDGETATQAAAAIQSGAVETPAVPHFLEHLVDVTLEAFNVKASGNTWQHYAVAATLLVLFYGFRRIVARWVFGLLRKLLLRTKTTFDDRLMVSLEAPVSAFVAVVGIFMALRVLKLPPSGDEVVRIATTVAFSLCFFWGIVRALSAALDHLTEVARTRRSAVAAFMPWIKKTLVTLFVVLAILMTAQSLGADVKAFLAGLGLGGLAFALAAQDTIANMFGSVVVAIDQPFKVGEAVKIGNFSGLVEDIGLRSTRLRAADKSLIILPNKMVAAEAVTNLARITQRRVEQIVGLTYDTTPEQLETIVEDIRKIILAEDEVDPGSVSVYFRDYSASSLDIWMVYVTKDPDFAKHMKLRQRINLAIMRTVRDRGLSFAFPTQTLELGDSTRKLLAANSAPNTTKPEATE